MGISIYTCFKRGAATTPTRYIPGETIIAQESSEKHSVKTQDQFQETTQNTTVHQQETLQSHFIINLVCESVYFYRRAVYSHKDRVNIVRFVPVRSTSLDENKNSAKNIVQNPTTGRSHLPYMDFIQTR